MNPGAGNTFAAERTHLARVRTAVALVLTCAIVGRATMSPWSLVCLAVLVTAVAATRLRPPGSHLLLTAAVLALAAIGLTAV